MLIAAFVVPRENSQRRRKRMTFLWIIAFRRLWLAQDEPGNSPGCGVRRGDFAMHTKIGKANVMHHIDCAGCYTDFVFCIYRHMGCEATLSYFADFCGIVFLPFILRFEGKKPSARELVLLGHHDSAGCGGKSGFCLVAAM